MKFADSFGVDSRRGAVVNAVLIDGAVHDPIARLWAQAERTRAYLVANRDDNHLIATLKTLRRFLSTATPGLWFDQLDERSKFVAEPARATQLYHIMNAIAELSAICARTGRCGSAGPKPMQSGATPHLSGD